MTTLSKEGEKAIEELAKRQTEGMKKLKDEFDKDAKKIAGKLSNKESRLKKLRFWGKSATGDTDDLRYWALVNVNALQNFVKYGANKVMDQIRIRTHANIIGREEIERNKLDMKKGFDVKQFAFGMILLIMAAAIAFILISNFFNYKTVMDDNIILSIEVGKVSGKLAACNERLAATNPNVPPPSGGSAQDNVLEG